MSFVLELEKISLHSLSDLARACSLVGIDGHSEDQCDILQSTDSSRYE